jgi:8-oxo-dGTP pyrophosphatase MutT (NUDIX family)
MPFEPKSPGESQPPQAEEAAPPLRKDPQPVETERPHAAVAIIRTAGDDPHYLLLRRAENPLDPWSGHFALPGGRREDRDGDILETSIRETLEETGFRLERGQMIQSLPFARAGGTVHATLVAPFLFEIPAIPDLILDTREIAESHWLSVRYLRDPANHDMAVMLPHSPAQRFPCIKVGGGAIWGFTYGLLRALLGRLP